MDGDILKYVSDNELNSLLYRAIGDSTRLIDGYVQEFFTKPMDTKIYVSDHYGLTRTENDRATILLIGRLRARIMEEHHFDCKGGKDNNGFYIIRTAPTYHELVLQEIERRKEKQ